MSVGQIPLTMMQRSYLFGVEEDVCLDAQYWGCKVRQAIGKSANIAAYLCYELLIFVIYVLGSVRQPLSQFSEL